MMGTSRDSGRGRADKEARSKLPKKRVLGNRGRTEAKEARPELPATGATRGAEKGGRNLVLLGVISIILAAATTGVSLAIYHNSGDIYLDRSRPGFLPDAQEIKEVEQKKEEYVFEKTGEMNMEALEEYLKKLEEVVKEVDGYEDPFGAEALSDEKLGV